MKDLFDLSGKVVLFTGASTGIGKAGAKLLAQKGAHVIISSRKQESCQAVVDEITADGGKAEALACHVGNMDDIQKAFEHIKSTHGRLDVLVNNAAANVQFGHVLDTTLEAFTKTVDVNIRGYFFMSVEAGKIMKAQGSGVIINTASINALSPGLNQSVYSMTKAAVVNMTKAFAKECAPLGIRCNALLPGLTKTKFAGALFDESVYDSIVQNIPMRRHAEPEEMAGTILYLASDASSYTNGECIVVDGGINT
ncbi:SDR family oxidoreductase [Marinibactrum halimedae]|uniref:Short-chain dehydrogenase n=1 Tax=Marinibactrum halimedae TaxID=1444977 RepID=A0AA37WKN2_9GAMM|nr:SDR family oxidoreductase [Marinibactrum halimedae]MCD9459108.1 SDR family oxidoreductase [Marinibactrum halimedae]GLS24709.1 short-chain dehydrogenase [Marinibactrum halimedae]